MSALQSCTLAKMFVVLALGVSSACAQGIITTTAGSTWLFRGDGGPALEAPLGPLRGVAVDAAGNLFAAAVESNVVVKISPNGILTVVAGNGLVGISGDGGPATASRLAYPHGIAVDVAGNVFIADRSNARIRKVSSEGTITTVAGGGRSGFAGDGGPATRALLDSPHAVAVDRAGNLYIADTFNHRIRKVSPEGIIITVVGDGFTGASRFEGRFFGDGGPATSASLNVPNGVAVDAEGNLYIADTNNHRIRKVTPSGIITTLAGDGTPGSSGDGGPATSARLSFPNGVAVHASGDVFIADTYNHRIRKVDVTGAITTVAGTGVPGYSGDGGAASEASLLFPAGVAVDAAGNLYIADTQNYFLRKVTAGGVISTVAGNRQFQFSGDGGPARASVLNFPFAVALDAASNLYLTDALNHRVRKISSNGTITTVAGNGVAGFSGDGGPATRASLNFFSEPGVHWPGVAVEANGTIYFSDYANHRVRRVNPAGIITTYTGNGTPGFSGDGGPATAAQLSFPSGLALDGFGNLYIADRSRVRKVTPAGIISTVAGGGSSSGPLGDDGPATSARLNLPQGVAVDSSGNVYIGDSGNNRVRKVNTSGTISTFAGNGIPGFSGDGGPAVAASLNEPSGIALDGSGNLYIVDTDNHRIRKVTTDGLITTVVGNGSYEFRGDGGPATAASIGEPFGVAADAAGNLYIADTGNDRIRAVLTSGFAGGPFFAATPARLSFSAAAGSPSAAPQQLQLSSTINSLAWQATVQTDAGGNWLSISQTAGNMPANVSVSVDATRLAPATYQGSVVISSPTQPPSIVTIPVTFAVSEAQSPRLTVQPSHLSFQTQAGTPPPAQSLSIGNAGSGSLSWTAQATSAGGNWLTIAPAAGDASAGAPATVRVNVNPAGLAAGCFVGSVTVRSDTSNESLTVSVTLQVSAPAGALLLSQSSLLFRAVEGGGAEPAQTFGVLNAGSGSIDWTAQAAVPWLRLAGASGRSQAGASAVPQVSVSVEPEGLAAGFYTGLVRVQSSGANNSPHVLKVDLQVLPRGATLGAVVRPTGLIFVAAAGGNAPSSQEVTVATPEAQPIEFLSQPIDGPWVRRAPDVATASRSNPGRIVVQPELGNLGPGVHRAALAVFTRNDGAQHPVSLLLLVLPPGEAALAPAGRSALAGQADGSPSSAAIAGSQCAPSRLLLQFASLFSNFNAAVGWPTLLQVNVRDDCGTPAAAGTVIVSFSSGDPAVTLTDLNNGQYQGAWRPNTANPLVAVTARGLWRGLQGEVTATAQVSGPANPPGAILSQGGVVLGAGFQRGPVAPGSIISLFGRNLAARENTATTLPLPRSLERVRVLIGEREAPLFYVGPGQVNAQVPFELPADRQLQVLVETNGVPSAPEPLQTVSARPGIFTLGPPFGEQGAILIANTDRVAMPTTANIPSEPARIGGFISIYCTGLGQTEPAVPTGEPGPTTPLATVRTPVAVTIGGQAANVTFAGLAPGLVGVYQVNAQVPAGIGTGDAVPVVLTQGGSRSNTATIAVR